VSSIGVGDRVRGPGGALDRAPQILPVPLGGLAPAHRHATALKRIVRRHRSTPLLALALAAGAGGVWLSTTSRTFEAGQDAAGVHVDDLTLTPGVQSVAGTRIFTGAATMVITTASGVIRSGAVMTWNGVSTTGRCTLRRDAAGASETCMFSMGATQLTSVDRFDVTTRTWKRRYGDGVEITIAVPTGTELMPVPFPLAR
jgi:hypothetical protein